MTVPMNQKEAKEIYNTILSVDSLEDKFKILCNMFAVHSILMDVVVNHVPQAKEEINKMLKEAKQSNLEH